MFRSLLVFFFVVSSGFADITIDDYKLLAQEIVSNKNQIIANGDVIIYNKSYILRAQKAIYDVNSSILELYENVNIFIDNEQFAKSDYIKVDLHDNRLISDNIFLYNSDSDIWFRSKDAKIYLNKFKVKKSIVSSCNVKKPDWKIVFSKGIYNKDKNFVHIYNPIFYARDIPILYLPYFGFSTNKSRKSGFLRPKSGYEEKEGFLYIQPFFYAPKENWDIQIDPQIRSNRGWGIYTTLRFVDSLYSRGELRFGAFKEKDSFAKKYNLENKVHLGAEFKYQNSQVLTAFFKKGYKDGLFIDFTHLNDIDYLNMQQSKKMAQSRLITSKLNYFLSTKNNYFGLYLKYFIDTQKDNNDDTLQTLPSLQYHRFSQNLLTESFPTKNILYSIDYKFKNNYADVGLRSIQQEISIPLNIHFFGLNDYLNFGISENFYYSKINYFERNASIENAIYFSNYHKFSLTSNLTKKYSSFLHNIQMDLSFIVPSFENKKGYFADFLHFNLERKSLNFKLNQYLYNFDGFGYFTNRLKQIIYLDGSEYEYADFENDIVYKFSKEFQISNSIFYSHKNSKISKMQSELLYKNSRVDFRLNHTYLNLDHVDNTSFLSSKLNLNLNKKYTLFGSIDYDIVSSFTREWRFGWKMRKRCWNYDISYKQSVTPSLTSSGAESLTKRGIYLTLRLLPIGGVSYRYEKEQSLIQKGYDEE